MTVSPPAGCGAAARPPPAARACADARRCCSAPPSSQRAAGSRRVQPIMALNPYQSWTIRVRAGGKGNLRTVKTARGEMKVFSLELTDEQARGAARRRFTGQPGLTVRAGFQNRLSRAPQGTTIQATAWREAADALFSVFEDGKARTPRRRATPARVSCAAERLPPPRRPRSCCR